MAAPSKPAPAAPSLMQIGGFVAIFLVIANGAFFFLSWMYFEDKRANVNLMLGEAPDSAHILAVRVAFAIFSVAIGTASFFAALAPRYVGHGIAAIAGLGSVIAALMAFAKDMP